MQAIDFLCRNDVQAIDFLRKDSYAPVYNVPTLYTNYNKETAHVLMFYILVTVRIVLVLIIKP